jgi:hypothetical protein
VSTLVEIQELYEQIMRSPEGEARDRVLSRLMTNMELEYHIPALQNHEWESRHKALITMYRKISMSRTTL